jgi:hypothetical protein
VVPVQPSPLQQLINGDFEGFVRSILGQQAATRPQIATREGWNAPYSTAPTANQPTGVTRANPNQPAVAQTGWPQPRNTVQTQALRSTPAQVAAEQERAGESATFLTPEERAGSNIIGATPEAGRTPLDPLTRGAPSSGNTQPGAVAPPPVSRETSPPGAAGAAPRSQQQQARPPSYAEWLSARGLRPNDQNFIRYQNEAGRWRTPNNQPAVPPGSRSEYLRNNRTAFAAPQRSRANGRTRTAALTTEGGEGYRFRPAGKVPIRPGYSPTPTFPLPPEEEGRPRDFDERVPIMPGRQIIDPVFGPSSPRDVRQL